MILQWYSRKHAGGEESGFETQRKQLRQQVRHSCHVTRYVSMSLSHSVYRNWHYFFVYWLRFFPRKPRCAGMRILVVPDVITPPLFRGTRHFAPKLLSFDWQIRSRCCCLINDCNRNRSVVASIVFSFILFFFKSQCKLWHSFSMLLFCYWQISRFITWLQEAEEESDDDDDDEEEWINFINSVLEDVLINKTFTLIA